MRAIIVFYDSLNRKYLNDYHSQVDVSTPNFNRLAKNAVTFDNSYVGSMPCIPARRELHTGRYNFLHREWGPLEPFDDSMPELLKKQGVYTHLISDHLHYWEDGGCNYHTRYSSWEIVRGQEGDHWIGHVGEVDIPEVVFVPPHQDGTGVASGWKHDWINRKHMKSEEDFPQYKVFDLGCEFIKENQQEDNWMLHIETFDPHEPFFAPDKYKKLHQEDYEGKHFDWPRGKATQKDNEIEHCRNQYKSSLSMCDEQLGRVLDLMDAYDMWKDTMLIVGTDHGFLLAEHGYWGKNIVPYFEEVAHTPCFIWNPKHPKKNVRRKSLVQLIDWAPTLLDYFNVDIPKDMQGKVLTPVIEEDEPIREVALFGVFSGHVNITDGEYVYMRAAHLERTECINNYTLMPMYMTKRIPVKELQSLELHDPFSFTKGCKVLKIPGKDKYGVNTFGHLLFNVTNDPNQLHPLNDNDKEEELIYQLVNKMKENDAPREQYYRLDIEKYLD